MHACMYVFVYASVNEALEKYTLYVFVQIKKKRKDINSRRQVQCYRETILLQ